MKITVGSATSLIALLRGFLWHATSLKAFTAILVDKSIKVNRGDLPNSCAQSACSNCAEENAVSLFDFVTHSDRDIIGEDFYLLDKWPSVMFRHGPDTLLLGIEFARCAKNLLFYPELKIRRGFGGIIPRVEVCHRGDIPLTAVQRVARWQGDTDKLPFLYPSVSACVSDLFPQSSDRA